MLSLASVLGLQAATPDTTIAKARLLREKGHFSKAEQKLSAALKDKSLSPHSQKRLAYEIDLLSRIRQDFPYTRDQLYQKLSQSIRDFSQLEFEKWHREGRFESRDIDGTEYFANTSVSNVYWRYPELEARRVSSRKREYYSTLLPVCRAVANAAAAENKPYVLPHRFRMTMTVTADKNAAPNGQIIRAWLPVPRRYPYQEGFKLLHSSSPLKNLADEHSPIRSAYLEQPATSDQETKFQLCYEYTRCGVRFDLQPEKATAYDQNDPNVQQFTREARHVVFSDKVTKLSAQIVGKETNPVRKARLIYDWIAANLKYSYALEYSTIPNISEYSLERSYGDCGQQALTFITLCRAQGIPARWQSGWFIFPAGQNIHDWTEIYLPTYGWVPVDPEFGNAVTRYGVALTPAEQKEMHEFYFGGLDPYRMSANCDHNQLLQPEKNTFRSDDVDFQRGELECGDKNIYFDQYSYDMQVEELK